MDLNKKLKVAALFKLTKNNFGARHYYLCNTSHYLTVRITNVKTKYFAKQSQIERYFRTLCPSLSTELFLAKNFALYTWDRERNSLFLHFKASYDKQVHQFIRVASSNLSNPERNMHYNSFSPTISLYVPRKRTTVDHGVLLLNVDNENDDERFLTFKLNENLGTKLNFTQFVRFQSKYHAGQPGPHVLLKFTSSVHKNDFITRFHQLNTSHGFSFNGKQIKLTDYVQKPRERLLYLCGKCIKPFHTQEKCFCDNFICGHCGGHHKTTDCTQPYKQFCVHCKSHSHSSLSLNCPRLKSFTEQGYKYVIKDSMLCNTFKISQNTKQYVKQAPVIDLNSSTFDSYAQKTTPPSSPISFNSHVGHQPKLLNRKLPRTSKTTRRTQRRTNSGTYYQPTPTTKPTPSTKPTQSVINHKNSTKCTKSPKNKSTKCTKSSKFGKSTTKSTKSSLNFYRNLKNQSQRTLSPPFSLKHRSKRRSSVNLTSHGNNSSPHVLSQTPSENDRTPFYSRPLNYDLDNSDQFSVPSCSHLISPEPPDPKKFRMTSRQSSSSILDHLSDISSGPLRFFNYTFFGDYRRKYPE